jgi:acyl-CoA thioesterase
VHEVRPGDCVIQVADHHEHTFVAGPDGLEYLVYGTRHPTEIGWLPRSRAIRIGWPWAEGRDDDPWDVEATVPPLEVGEPEPRPGNILNVDEVEPVPQERALVPIAQRFVVQPALGAGPFSEADEALTGGWIAFREGAPPLDAFALAMLADAWIPSPFMRLDRPVGAPTVDLTIHFRAPDLAAEWPVLCVFRSHFAHGGFFEEDGELWSTDGRLLAQSRQLGLLSP